MKIKNTLILMTFLSLWSCRSDEPFEEEPMAGPGFCPVTILEYSPMPGQFINELPEYKNGMDTKQMLEAVNVSINSGELVSLGGWGGTIIYRLDKYIENKPGADFRIVGNSYYTRVIDGVQYGSCEPGIVFVMEDTNGNGLPDDTWYELWGSVSDKAFFANVVYEKNDTDAGYGVKVKQEGEIISEWIYNPEYHDHTFFPKWLETDKMYFKGKMLPSNAIKLENGQYTQECYEGYADSQPNNSENSCLDISSARDKNGNFVSLTRIDFIKVQTGVLQFNGAIGECSTEVGRIQVL